MAEPKQTSDLETLLTAPARPIHDWCMTNEAVLVMNEPEPWNGSDERLFQPRNDSLMFQFLLTESSLRSGPEPRAKARDAMMPSATDNARLRLRLSEQLLAPGSMSRWSEAV